MQCCETGLILCLTTEILLSSRRLVEKSPQVMEEKDEGREELLKAFISNFELMDKHVTEVNSGNLTYKRQSVFLD